MSTLTLVRHGQARPFEADPDRLSPLGEAQARALGEHWAREGARFDEVVRGSLARHRQTEEQARAAGFAMPEATQDAGWDEYDADAILRALGPQLAERDSEFAAKARAFDAAAPSQERNRHFQRMFEILMEAWRQGRVSADGVEPYAVYRERVLAALRRVVDADGSGRNVVVFTSGGPVGLCVQHALRAPDAAFLEVNWRIRNCSTSEFTFSRGRLSLDSLNVLSHLRRALWTWR